MSKAKITLLGFYEWDSTLFDSIQLSPLINKETLINNILLECGEFEVLYGDPSFYKNAVNHFFTLNYDLFNRWATDLQREYNPLENYDRIENWTDSSENLSSESEHTSNSMTTTGSTTANSTDTISSTDTTASTSLNEKSAYDNNTLVADTKNTTNSTVTNSTTDTNSSTDSNTQSANNSGNRGTSASNSGESEHNGRIHGNIGVTTSQQMLESELLLRQKWQLVKIITDMFMNDLTIPIYN